MIPRTQPRAGGKAEQRRRQGSIITGIPASGQKNCRPHPVAGRAESGACGNTFGIRSVLTGCSSSRPAVSLLRQAYGGQGARGYRAPAARSRHRRQPGDAPLGTVGPRAAEPQPNQDSGHGFHRWAQMPLRKSVPSVTRNVARISTLVGIVAQCPIEIRNDPRRCTRPNSPPIFGATIGSGWFRIQ